MSDNLKESIEDIQYCYESLFSDPDDRPGYLNSAMAVVRAYLAEHPDDENEAVTVEWLLSVGFAEDDQATEGVDYVWINSGDRAYFDLQCWFKNTWRISDSDNDIALPAPMGRGDVRRLCAALGIKLKETK